MTLSDDKLLRVVTYNVHYGNDIDAIARAFRDNKNLSQADIIFLQEMEYHADEKISRTQRLADALRLKHVYAPGHTLRGDDTHGLAILSKYDLRDIKTIPLPLHRIFFRSQQRIALMATMEVEGTQLTLANIHLDTLLDNKRRIEQVKTLIPILGHADAGAKIIVGGDFNTMPLYFYKSFPLFYQNQRRLIDKYFIREGFIAPWNKNDYTMKVSLLRLKLDGIYTRGLKAVQCRIEYGVNASDHKPLWIDVALSTGTSA